MRRLDRLFSKCNIQPARRFGDAYRARFSPEIAPPLCIYTVRPSAVHVLKTQRIGGFWEFQPLALPTVAIADPFLGVNLPVSPTDTELTSGRTGRRGGHKNFPFLLGLSRIFGDTEKDHPSPQHPPVALPRRPQGSTRSARRDHKIQSI